MRVAKFMLAVAGALIASLFVPLSAAHAYPDAMCTIEAPASVGASETFSATVRSDTGRDLAITFAGDTRTRSNASSLKASFTAPAVSEPTQVELSASCGDDVAAALVEIEPDGESDDAVAGDSRGALSGILPDTGGSPLWLLGLGAVAVLVGGTVVIRRQRA